MRLMQRNLQTVYYCLYQGKQAVLDNGMDSGAKEGVYAAPVAMECYLTPVVGGEARPEPFGAIQTYQYTMITDDLSCPIDEHTLLYVYAEPASNDASGANASVIRVSRSLDTIEYAVALNGRVEL